MSQQLYQSPKNPDTSKTAAVVLPEIFGLNGFIKSTTDRFAQELGYKAFALDHFYPVTGENKLYVYSNHEEPMKTMQQVTGKGFVAQFTTAIDEIQRSNPEVSNFIVCGFCFGGKLAFLTGVDKRVNRIISFYGAGATQPDFYQDKSVIEALCDARKADSRLKVIGFFGDTDQSIPEPARTNTKQLFEAASINYLEKVYSAGHAFMNFERDNMHNAAASKQAWSDVVAFLAN